MKLRLPFKSGFSVKVSISFSLIFIFAILMIIFFIFWGIPFTPIDGHIQHLRLDFYNDLNLIANMKKEQILHWIKDRSFDIEIFSSNTFIVEDITKLRLKLSNGLEQGLELDELMSEILVDESYSDLFYFLENILNTSGFYSNIYIADPETGIVFVSTDAESLGLNLSGMDCFHDTFLTQRVHIGDCLVNSGSESPIIHFSYVVKDKQNNIIGIMVMTVDQDIVQHLLFPSTSGFEVREEVVLVNDRSEILMPLKYPLANGETAEINKYKINTKKCIQFLCH